MDRVRVNRAARVARVGMAPVLGPNAAHTILTVTDDGSGQRLFTMAGPHGLTAGATINVSGTSGGGLYDGLQAVDDVPSPTTTVSFSAYAGDATGGSWVLV